MKIISVFLVIVFLFMITGCGDKMIINGTEYDTYGLINKNEERNPEIKYEVIWENVIWGSILFGTVIAPVYFFGFSLFEPVGLKGGAYNAK